MLGPDSDIVNILINTFWTVVLEKTLESPLDYKEIKPVYPKGNQSWLFIGRTDAEAETPILWPHDAKNWLIGKDPDAGKDWGQEEKGSTEDEMVGWHHWLNGCEFEQAPGVGDGQGSLGSCSSWGHKESDVAERPNWHFSPIVFQSFSLYLFILKWSCEYDHNRWCAAHVKSCWTVTVFSSNFRRYSKS